MKGLVATLYEYERTRALHITMMGRRNEEWAWVREEERKTERKKERIYPHKSFLEEMSFRPQSTWALFLKWWVFFCGWLYKSRNAVLFLFLFLVWAAWEWTYQEPTILPFCFLTSRFGKRDDRQKCVLCSIYCTVLYLFSALPTYHHPFFFFQPLPCLFSRMLHRSIQVRNCGVEFSIQDRVVVQRTYLGRYLEKSKFLL